MDSNREELNSVQKFYAEKIIFITGASGFMGKVLMEKLLYSCSDVKEIIILMRPKRGLSAIERVNKFKDLAMFSRIIKEKPEVMNKIVPVYGEITIPNFGLSPEHLKKVLSSEIVFHMAASLKLEATLRPNILFNLIGTKYALDLAKQMKNLLQMVHLSTAYCNVEPERSLEIVYPHEHNPDDLIRMAEWMSDSAMEAVQKEILGVFPNTYVYTKRLAEILIEREYKNGLPISIARPSAVLPALLEPFPGWVDSLNGVVGIFYAAGKGVLRSMLANPKSYVEYIPVDMSIAALIMMPKLIVTNQRLIDIPIYHITVHDTQKIEMGEIFNMIEVVGRKYPSSWALWYPDGNMTTNRYKNAVYVFLFQMIPAYVIDFLLFCFRQKRFMVYVQKRIADGTEALQFFTMRSWRFNCDKFQDMHKLQSPSEHDMFFVDCLLVKDNFKYIENCIIGGREYACHDPPSTLPLARVVNKIQYVLHITCKCLFYWFVFKYLLKAFGVYESLLEFFSNGSRGFN